MAKRESKGLFQRLTRLFRSGPVVKRKIRALDTMMAGPDKSKSSGTLLFQKSLSPTYATITSNAYNLSERLMRYQDFQEMEYTPEIAAALDIYCLSANSVISTPEGDFSISELLEQQTKFVSEACDEKFSFPIYSYDSVKRCITIGKAHSVRKTGTNAEVIEVKFDNGKSIRCTPTHKFMTRSGTWVEARDLTRGTALMPYKTTLLGPKGNEYKYVYTMDKIKTKSGWRAQHLFNFEHLVGQIPEGHVVHHKDFNRENNKISNLQLMSEFAHQSLHASINNVNKLGVENHKHASWMIDHNPVKKQVPTLTQFLSCKFSSFDDAKKKFGVSSVVINEWLRGYGFTNWTAFVKGHQSTTQPTQTRVSNSLSVDEIKRAYVTGDSKSKLTMKLGCTVNVFDKFLNRKLKKTWVQLSQELGGRSLNNKGSGRPKGVVSAKVSFQDICDAIVPGKYLTREELAAKLNTSQSVITNRIVAKGFVSYTDFVQCYENCKVTSVEPAGREDVYDITVDEHHNFACEGVIIHNSDETVAQDEKGRALHVFSDNEKIKEVLEDLFYNTLNVEFNLRSWVRNLCKYGDLFLFNDVSPTHGVVNVFPIPVNELEREENYDREDPFAVRFRWVTMGNRVLENWEISHFRLLGNDMFLPYGSSVIEPARRIWRQLILIEDAMLVYRVVRAPERRVFYIDVANIPPENVPMYVEEQRKNLRTSSVVDKTSGRVDLRYNPLCFRGNTRVPLLDGRTITIADLVDEWSKGRHDHETYTVDLKHSGRLVPGKVIWAGKSGIATQMTKITLDDGGTIEVTPSHKMMLRDGNPIHAKDLKAGDSLMPLHVRFKTMLNEETTSDEKNAYEQVLDPASGDYYYTHRLVTAHNKKLKVYSKGFIEQQGYVIHHVNFNKRDNSSKNLELMTLSDHSKLHSEVASQNIVKYNRSEAKRKKTSEDNRKYKKAEKMGAMYNGTALHASHNVVRAKAQKLSWETKREQRCDAMSYVWTPDCQRLVIDLIKQKSKFEGLEAFLRGLKNDEKFMQTYADANKHLARDPSKSLHKHLVGKFITKDYADWKSIWAAHHPSALGRKFVNNVVATNVANDGPKDHKVVLIETFDVNEDVYNVTVDEHHNLAIQANNCTSPNDGKVVSFQSVDEDYFIPVRGSDTGTKIDTLAGGQNTAAVEDVAYIQKKLFAALKIPRAYLGYDEMLSSKATLAQEDIRFSRTISVIQKTLIAELNKLAIIHLYSNGYDAEDLQNFTLRLSNPSTVAQQQKLELWRSKFEIAGSLPEGMGSKQFVQTEIWGLSEDQIEAITEQRYKEKAIDDAIENGAEGGGEEGGTGGGDLFGDEGGGAPEGGGEAGGGTETPPEENAGEEAEEKVEPDTFLLTSNDDPDEGSYALKMTMKDLDSPVKVQKQLKRALYNRGRQRTHGASKTHMPDYNKMTGHDSESMRDPFDSSWLRSVVSNPLGENRKPQRITVDVMSTLRRMNDRFEVAQQQQPVLMKEDHELPMLSESTSDDDEDVLIIDDDEE